MAQDLHGEQSPVHRAAIRPHVSRAVPNLLRLFWVRFCDEINQASALRRTIHITPVALIVGMLAYLAPVSEPAPIAIVMVPIISITFFAMGLWQGKTMPWLGTAAAIGIGFGLLPVHGALRGGEMLAWPQYGTFEAVVEDVISNSPDGQRLVIGNIKQIGVGKAFTVRRARLFVRPDALSFSRGDVIRGPIRFAPVPGPPHPGGYDAQFHAYHAGIGSYATATRPPELIGQASSKEDLSARIDELRRSIGLRIDLHLDGARRVIARALIIGDQSYIPQDLRSTMADAGLAHVLAISGLHLSLVAGGAFLILRLSMVALLRGRIDVPAKQLSAMTGIAIALIYLCISGASISASRATLMLILIFGAVLFGRQALTMRNVAFAAIVVILMSPESVFRPGFQLSFAAVVGLVGVYEIYQCRVSNDGSRTAVHRVFGYVWGVALTSAIASGATLVFALYHFQQTAPLSVFGNILALPLVAFLVLPSAAFAVLLMPIQLDGPLLMVMGFGIDRVLEVANLISAFSADWIAPPLLSQVSLLIALAAIGWFAFFLGRARWVGPVFAIPFIASFGLSASPDILIADRSQAVAVHEMEGQMGLLSGRTGSFVTDVWEETYQVSIGGTATGASCDDLACIWSGQGGFNVALVKNPAVFGDECGEVDLVVTRLRAPSYCSWQTQVIDVNALREYGVHSLRWEPRNSSFGMETAIRNPSRPWRPSY